MPRSKTNPYCICSQPELYHNYRKLLKMGMPAEKIPSFLSANYEKGRHMKVDPSLLTNKIQPINAVPKRTSDPKLQQTIAGFFAMEPPKGTVLTLNLYTGHISVSELKKAIHRRKL